MEVDTSCASINSLLKSSDESGEDEEDHKDDDVTRSNRARDKIEDHFKDNVRKDLEEIEQDEAGSQEDDDDILLLESPDSAKDPAAVKELETLVDNSCDTEEDDDEVMEIVSTEDDPWSGNFDKKLESFLEDTGTNYFDSIVSKLEDQVSVATSNAISVDKTFEEAEETLSSIAKSLDTFEECVDEDEEVIIEEDPTEDVSTEVSPNQEVALDEREDKVLDIGSRCFAKVGSQFCPGVVADVPKRLSKSRYLIFFDHEDPGYVDPSNIRGASLHDNSLESLQEAEKGFLTKYFQNYPENPLLRLTVGEMVKVEEGGRWWNTIVTEVDCSLVLVTFERDQHMKWIYRGSPRLGPMFAKANQEESSKPRKGSYAKKSTAKRKTVDDSNEGIEISRDDFGQSKANEGTIVQASVPRRVVSFQPHSCSSQCLDDADHFSRSRMFAMTKNILTIPLHYGWTRQTVKHSNKGQRKVCYVAPCGRRLRNLRDVVTYLSLTHSELEIDFFNFDWWVHVLDEFQPADQSKIINKDLSYGTEPIPVSCFNNIDSQFPEFMEYSTTRLPQANVNINTDPSFLTCCDCKDDCQDPRSCSCIQLTIQSTRGDNRDNAVNRDVGYDFRRIKVFNQLSFVYPSLAFISRATSARASMSVTLAANVPRLATIELLRTPPGPTSRCSRRPTEAGV